jgi:excisionase family DNA binding protein
MDEKMLLTVGQVADALSVSQPTVRRMVARGELRPVQIQRSVRFVRDEIVSYVDSKKGQRGGDFEGKNKG